MVAKAITPIKYPENLTLRQINPTAKKYFFVVTKSNGRETPSIVYDELVASKEALLPQIIWSYELDNTRDPDLTLKQIWDMYLLMKSKGTLPASNIADKQREDKEPHA